MSKIQNKKIVAKEYPLKDILSNNKYKGCSKLCYIFHGIHCCNRKR